MGQHDGYADPKFGIEQAVVLPASGSLAGTVAATEITRHKTKRACVVNDIGIQFTAGGTAATRKLLLGLSLAGTGATSQLGTYTLGTAASNTTALTGLSGTFAAGDDIVISHLGTDAIVYNVRPTIFYTEKFVQA